LKDKYVWAREGKRMITTGA